MFKNQKKGRNKTDFRALWQNGEIQKKGRITYDVVWNVILFFVIIGVIGLFFAGGVGAGYFASLVKDQPVTSESEMRETIYNYAETSTMFFSDETEIGDVSSDIYREEIQLDQVSEHLKNAVIATEDKYFGEHRGVVPKAVMRAVVQEVTNSAVKTGGSTLTQQLVKNQILTNEVSFERKAKEMLLALRVEKFLEKDEILEAYLNIVPFGRNSNGQNVAGVQTAAQGIFGIDASELNLAQSAFIAGLPQSPFGYTPFYNDGSIKEPEKLEPGIDRMHEVLERMLEAEYITQAQYDEAMKFKINKETLAEPKATANGKFPAINAEVKSRAKEKIKAHLMKENGHTKKDLEEDDSLAQEYDTLAERELTSGGYEIHTTIDQEVYETMQKVRNSYREGYWPHKWVRALDPETGKETDKKIPLQLSSMIIENSTGKIYGFIGGIDFEEEQLNHATQADRSIGSTIKPLLVYGPSFDLGAAQPGSVIADVPYNYTSPPYSEVQNFSQTHHGFVSVRRALKESYNIPAVKQYVDIIPKNPGQKYLEKMGFRTLADDKYTYPSLALGTQEYTMEENANGYATLGNMGKHVDAYMIEKIETKDGEVIYQHEAKETEVFRPQSAYLTLDVMRDVLDSGTASLVNGLLNNPGVDWAGKTGTSQDRKDSWFMATNPNVTVGMWTGYAKGHIPESDYYRRTQSIWADVVNEVSKTRPDLMIPDRGFQSPGGIVKKSYCATSGLLASNLCSSVGLSASDIYEAEHAPTKTDDSLVNGDFVRVKGDLVQAGPNTPSEFINDGGGVTLSPEFLEENGYTSGEVLRELIPNSSKWNNVALPSSNAIGSAKSSIENDGKAPAAPGSVNANGSRISWSASGSNDVVGYRVYRASTPGGSFSLLGSTTDTSYSFSGNEGIYAVRAVDYFGESSGLSSTVTVGNPGQPEPEQKQSNSENSREENRSNEGSNNESTENNSEDESEANSGNSDSEQQSNEDAGQDSNGNGSEAGNDGTENSNQDSESSSQNENSESDGSDNSGNSSENENADSEENTNSNQE